MSPNTSKLEETASSVLGRTKAKTTIVAADVTDEASVKKIADAVDTWNVLIHAAAYLSAPAPAAKAEIGGDYWQSYEVGHLASHYPSSLFA
ncbi:hypothetical protein GGS20DRAFT_581381 [Poronia punctata]|nr:hypothetical protein GGS20DRAFT_581381 [Poronia punctata]